MSFRNSVSQQMRIETQIQRPYIKKILVTHTQTDRHGNSMTDPVKRAESVKIEKLKMRGGVTKSRTIVFFFGVIWAFFMFSLLSF